MIPVVIQEVEALILQQILKTAINRNKYLPIKPMVLRTILSEHILSCSPRNSLLHFLQHPKHRFLQPFIVRRARVKAQFDKLLYFLIPCQSLRLMCIQSSFGIIRASKDVIHRHIEIVRIFSQIFDRRRGCPLLITVNARLFQP